MKILDFLLHNVWALYLFLIFYIVLAAFIFHKINKISLFVLTIIIAIKFVVLSKLEDYFKKKRELNQFRETHFVSITVLISLLISVPGLLIVYKLGEKFTSL